MEQDTTSRGGPQEEQSSDYGYDLAHEASGSPEIDPDRPPPPPTYVATESSDHDQDYSYDLAHDIPEIREQRHP